MEYLYSASTPHPGPLPQGARVIILSAFLCLTPDLCLLTSVFFLQILAHALHGAELAAHAADVGLLRQA